MKLQPVETEMEISLTLDWQAAFAGWLEEAGRSKRTVQAYLQDVRLFAAWFEENNGQPFTPELITSWDLRAWRNHTIDGGAKPATWNRRRATLAVLCEWALAVGYLTYNPFQGVNKVEEEEQAPRWLDGNEQHRLLRQVEQAVNGAGTAHWRWQALRDQAMIGLMLWAGLRETEVAQLNVGDVETSERKGKVIIRRGKRTKYREVPLNNEARRALRVWLEASGIQTGALFLGKGGGRITGKGIQDRVAAIRMAAGLDADVTPHALRHTFAKNLIDQGQPMTVVAKLMGHTRMDTLARYIQPGWKDLEKAVEGKK